MMLTPHMFMQIRPAQTSDIAVFGGAVVAEEEDGVFHDIVVLVPDTETAVCAGHIREFEVFV